jgi:hypothetical protein
LDARSPLTVPGAEYSLINEILECFLEGSPVRDEYLIISGGGLAGTGAHSYKL